ncbi:ATP-binding protein [Tessaracoccus sp. G1721]
MASQETQFGFARSSDGRTFRVQVVADELQVGALVALRTTGATFVGQVLSAGEDLPAMGVVLGELTDEGLAKERRPFADAAVFGLTAGQVESLQASGGASLPVGQWQLPGNAGVLKLKPQGFNRHTFLCGQSGSGKTYALGVILEQLILATRLPMVVLDPNGDYVSLGAPRADAPAGPAEAIRSTPMEVRGANGPDRLTVTFMDLPPRIQAAVLELDPIRDRSEYAAWMEMDVSSMRQDSAGTIEQLLTGDEEHRAFGQRLTNLGVASWPVWSKGVVEPTPEREPRVRIFDLSEFENRSEALIAAIAMVETLWMNRADRRPTLLVIDEAHNLCPADPSTPLERALVDRLIQIAAEGRKYGLWLLLSTQRPSKVHPQVVSQCDNLVLMRMNSPADLDELGRFFGFVPRGMLDASPYFTQGEMLVAGGFVPVPSFGRVGQRLTVEPGTDVRVPMPD